MGRLHSVGACNRARSLVTNPLAIDVLFALRRGWAKWTTVGVFKSAASGMPRDRTGFDWSMKFTDLEVTPMNFQRLGDLADAMDLQRNEPRSRCLVS